MAPIEKTNLNIQLPRRIIVLHRATFAIAPSKLADVEHYFAEHMAFGKALVGLHSIGKWI